MTHTALRVPFLDVGAAYRELRAEVDAAVHRTLESGWYVLGRELAAFEADFARYAGARECVGVADGLAALSLGLRALGVGPGDEVLVPANTFIATWLAVSYVGATPIPVEPDPDTYTISADALAAAVTARARAVIPVHLYGHPAEMDAVERVAAAHGLRVLADAAQAHGATYRGRPVGATGDAAAWSFYPGKNLGALGDAGALTTSDPGLADAVRVLRNYGSRVKYEHLVPGVNSRLDEIQAAVLSAKLARLDEFNARRAAVAEAYGSALDGLGLVLPRVAPWATSAWHLYVVRVSDRDEFQRELRAAGVETVVHYPVPPHLQPAYASLGYGPGDFPLTERIHREVVSLPIGPHLPEADVAYVVDTVRAVCSAGAAR